MLVQATSKCFVSVMLKLKDKTFCGPSWLELTAHPWKIQLSLSAMLPSIFPGAKWAFVVQGRGRGGRMVVCFPELSHTVITNLPLPNHGVSFTPECGECEWIREWMRVSVLFGSVGVWVEDGEKRKLWERERKKCNDMLVIYSPTIRLCIDINLLQYCASNSGFGRFSFCVCVCPLFPMTVTFKHLTVTFCLFSLQLHLESYHVRPRIEQHPDTSVLPSVLSVV